jgi:TonB family protein
LHRQRDADSKLAPALLALAVLAGCAARAPEASEYPREALAANAQASVVLGILIDETGRVREAKVIREPGHGFGVAAMRSALAHFRFSPPRLNGRPVATWWVFTVIYVLP